MMSYRRGFTLPDYLPCYFRKSSIRNYLRKINITTENRNTDEHTKVYETILKSSKGSKTFYKVLIGKAENANTHLEKITLGTDIYWNKVFWKKKKNGKLS